MCYKRKYLPQVGFVVKETSLIQKQPSTWVLQLPRSCTRHDLVAPRISHVTVRKDKCNVLQEKVPSTSWICC